MVIVFRLLTHHLLCCRRRYTDWPCRRLQAENSLLTDSSSHNDRSQLIEMNTTNVVWLCYRDINVLTISDYKSQIYSECPSLCAWLSNIHVCSCVTLSVVLKHFKPSLWLCPWCWNVPNVYNMFCFLRCLNSFKIVFVRNHLPGKFKYLDFILFCVSPGGETCGKHLCPKPIGSLIGHHSTVLKHFLSPKIIIM